MALRHHHSADPVVKENCSMNDSDLQPGTNKGSG